MALGFTYSSGGDFLPIVKYDARSGRMFRVDRADGVSVPHDITRNLKMVVDFDNLEVGFINFATGGAPDFQMVPFGEKLPEKRSAGHKQGVRVLIKLGAESGGDVRELSSCAGAFLRGFDALHTEYEVGAKENPGKLPVVTLEDSIPIKSGSGDKSSTNYEPQFKIASWVNRPKDLVSKPRGGGQPAATPPSTGATQVSAPQAKQPAMADAEDFG